jgi:hypothetical protein
MEWRNINVRGLEIAYNKFRNEVSLAYHKPSEGYKTRIHHNEGDLGGDTYFLELVGSDFEVFQNKVKGTGIFAANFQKNGVWSGWNIYDNEMYDAPATPGWAGLILVGADGVVNSKLGPNKFPAGRELIRYMGKTGGFTIVNPNQ